MTLVLLGDRDDQAEVRVDHPVLGLHVSLLDLLRQLDLLGGGQEREPAGFVQEELQRVGRRGREVAVDVRGVRRRRAAAVVGEADPALLDLRVERLELVVVQLQILHGRAELGQVETAGLFTGVENRCECLAAHQAVFPAGRRG